MSALPITRSPSPHHSARPAGTKIDAVILHADGGTSEAGTLSWLRDPRSKVSYHYLVGRLGVVWQIVDDARRAWHAGKSTFMGRANCNDYSLGVSFANNQKGQAFTAAQLAAGVTLVADLCVRHGIPTDRITTHAIVSPGRKSDPGPLFSLSTFRAEVAAEIARRTAPTEEPTA